MKRPRPFVRIILAATCVGIALAAGRWLSLELSPPKFNPAPYLGAWRGHWITESGRQGAVDLEVEADGDVLRFYYSFDDVTTAGLPTQTEHLEASIRGSRAIIDEHPSEVFGKITGMIDEHGSVELECEDIPGIAERLTARGAWSSSSAAITVSVTYGEHLGVGQYVVRLDPHGRD